MEIYLVVEFDVVPSKKNKKLFLMKFVNMNIHCYVTKPQLLK
jgi:hypothetical protein